MSALRFITRAAIAAAICGAALADPAHAKIAGHAGELIAFERGGDIWVRSPGVAINITNSPDAVDRAPSWGAPDDGCPGGDPTSPPSQRNLVFESRPSGGHSDLMVARLTGDQQPVLNGAIENLTNTPDADEGTPAAGTYSIAYTLGPVGSRDIWVRPLAGGAARQLTTSSLDDRNPDLSGNDISLVYETPDSAGTPQLAIIDDVAAPGLPRFVTAGPEQHTDPSWIGALDGGRIVHVVTAYGVTYLDFLEQRPADPAPAFSAPLLHQLTGDPGGDLAPSWHPEASGVVFAGDRAQAGNLDIYSISANGTGLARLTTDPAADRDPDFEPWFDGWCLQPEPYSPRPGTQSRTDRRPTPPKTGGSDTPGAHKPQQPTQTSQPVLRVANLRVTQSGTGTRRIVTVRFVVNRAARGSLRLLRSGRTIARRVNRPLAAGRATIRLNVPRTAPRGRYRLRLTVAAGPLKQTINRTIRIRALRQRR